MAVVATLDLASVTDALVEALDTAVEASPLWTGNGGPVARFSIKVSGMAFDLARKETDMHLCLALVHVGPDTAHRNLTVRGPSGVLVPLQPAPLVLTYAVSAFAGKEYAREQQAMGIALAWILSSPTQRLSVAGTPARQVDVSLTLETMSVDEMSRLWQAISGAIRVTAILRVGVVFLGPDPSVLTPQPPPDQMAILAGPGAPADSEPRLLAATEPVPVGDGHTSPWRPGETIIVAGLALDGPEKLFLSPLDDSASTDITAWARDRRTHTLHLRLPTASPPGPGRYRLRIGAAPHLGDGLVVEIGS